MGFQPRECLRRPLSAPVHCIGMIQGPGLHQSGRRSEHLLFGVEAPETSKRSFRYCGKRLAMMSTSLSPLPDRFTIIESCFSSFFASFPAKLSAWAGSSAGIIPSFLDSVLKASRASWSEAVTYLALPEVIRYECSGPTPG